MTIVNFPGGSDLKRLKLVKVKEAAATLAYDEKTIRRMVARGELEGVGRGQLLRVTLRSIEAYIERGRN